MKIIIPFLITFVLSAAVPTPEGLLRNGNNKEPSGDTIIYDFMIEEMPIELSESNVSIGSVEGEISKESLEEKKKKKFYKIYLGYKDNKSDDALQIKYKDSKMGYEHIEELKYLKDFNKTVKEENSLERKVFYSLMTSLLVNDSSLFGGLLTEFAPKFQPNEVLINENKKELYANYKSYLIATKEDETIKGELESPMAPKDEKKMEEVKEILASSMYKKSETVSLVKIDDRFFWNLDLENARFLFTNENHRFSLMEMESPLGKISVRAGNYVLFDGIHELPKEIIFQSVNGKLYRLKSLSLRHINGTKTMSQRKKMFEEKIEEISKKKKASDSEESEVEEEFTIPLVL